jgi:membrane-associated phospholipid phosphatase
MSIQQHDLRGGGVGIRELARRGFIEITLVSGLFMAYFTTRGLVAGRESEAFINAYQLMQIQRQLGIFWELAIQDWVLGSPTLIWLMNAIYMYTHMPAVILFAAWVFLRHHDRYPEIRNIFLGMLGGGLLIYTLHPLAPPRFFTATGFVDTLEVYSPVDYHQESIQMLYNPYAAMPSLHVGFAVFVGIGLYMIGGHWIFKALGIIFPLLMSIAVVATGNHFILDAVAGTMLAAGAYILVPKLAAALQNMTARSDLEAEAAST